MFPDFDKQPINDIKWMPVTQLDANDYNPNHVMNAEFQLLKHSLLASGWIQPILVAKTPDSERYTIIDGFHRSTLAKVDPQVNKMTNGLVPCCVMEMTQAERKMLTVRINRAKGSHSSIKMHDLVKSLIVDEGMAPEVVAKGIGATKHEINTLLQENLFEKFDVDNHEYSQAWMPR